MKKPIILLIALSLLSVYTLSLTIYHRTQSDQSALVHELSDSLLRFRVLANSDSPEDKYQKDQLSRDLVQCISPLLSQVSSKQEAVNILSAHCNDIAAQASALSGKYGTKYSVTCTIGPHLFPYRTYGSYRFPSGTYDTLLVTIGHGKGSNWWCLAFPALCFTDSDFPCVPPSSGAKLNQVLSDEAYALISCVPEKNENGSRRFCFRLLPFLNRFLP